MSALLRGLVAGAAGTTALNAVTYLDMALRGRPASTTPEQSVQRLADTTGISLGSGPDGAEKAENRKAGLGPLLGYATGLGVTVGYGLLLRSLFGGRRPPWPASALALTALAMVAANVPMTATGLTDPRKWTAADWAADVVPHLAYGAVAAVAYDKLS